MLNLREYDVIGDIGHTFTIGKHNCWMSQTTTKKILLLRPSELLTYRIFMSLTDLTKQQVVEVLAEFEEKLPNIGTKIFEPDRWITSFDLQKINIEASRML